MRCSVFNVCPSVLGLSNLKLHKTEVAKNNFKQEKLILSLTFNPWLELTGFRTTRPAAGNNCCCYPSWPALPASHLLDPKCSAAWWGGETQWRVMVHRVRGTPAGSYQVRVQRAPTRFESFNSVLRVVRWLVRNVLNTREHIFLHFLTLRRDQESIGTKTGKEI